MVLDNKPIEFKPAASGFAPEIAGAAAGVPALGDAASDNGGESKGVAPTDTEHETPGLTAEQERQLKERQEMKDALAGTDRQIRTVQEWMDAEAYRPETKEQREKRERQEKSKRIIAAVSDGLSAMGNLFFTTQYAPNMYDHEKGAGKTVDAHLDKLKAERERARDRYYNFAMKMGDLENQRAATVRELEALRERQKLAREKAEREQKAFEFDQSLWDDRRREQSGKADRAGYEAYTAGVEARYAPQMQEAKIDTEKARKKNYDAGAANSYASAAAHNRSNVAEFSAWDEEGNEYKFTKPESAEAFARRHGTWQEEDVSETTSTETRRKPNADPQTRTTTKTKKGGYPARPAQGTMPGVKDDTKMPGTK